MSIAIRADHVSKEYRLGIINHGMLYKDMQSWAARRFGRQDPHEKIGKQRFEDQTDRFWALKDVSFEIEQGDRVGIIGRNGAGKSTLLKILSRITEPTEGIIKLRGRVASLLEVGTGFHPELTGRDNIYLSGAIRGMKKREIDGKIDEIIDFSEIEKFIDTPVKRYSSGMYVRLAFAVAAHLDSEIILADEVLAVGDQAFQKKCLGKMEDVSKSQGRTVIFVSHNMGAVKSLCTQGILLNAGSVLAIGDIDIVARRYVDNGLEGRQGTSISYPEDGAKDFQALRIMLLNQKHEEMNVFDVSEEVIIELDCISRRPIPGLQGYLLVASTEGAPIIACDSSETENNPLDRMPVGGRRLRLKIPAFLLGVGEYQLYLNFTSSRSMTGVNVDSPKEVCLFNVVDNTTKRGPNRRAATSVLIKWEDSALSTVSDTKE